MGTLDRKEIDKIAAELLQAVFGDRDYMRFPLDLNPVVQYCGFTIRQGDFVAKEILGALDLYTGTIFLSDTASVERKAFVAAHELGHFLLHEDIETDIFTTRQLGSMLSQEVDTKENQADLFAIDLLMPERSIKSLWVATNKRVVIVAKIFGVPIGVASYRLNCLGLL